MLLGSIYGFIFVWGPIIWALIGLIMEHSLESLISSYLKGKNGLKRNPVDVVMIVECQSYH